VLSCATWHGKGTLLNIVVGIVGAMLGGFLLPLLGFADSNINNTDFSLSGLLVAFVGAVILIWRSRTWYSALNWNVFSPTALLVAYFSAVALLVGVKLMRTGVRST
jgi:uncharacterized membrane protein YeaQ/YmgE (transglycosylase-associated protein family)